MFLFGKKASEDEKYFLEPRAELRSWLKIVLTSSFRNAILKLQILSPGKFTLDILNFHSAQKQTSAANKRLSKKNPWHTKRISVRRQYMKDFFLLFLKSWKKGTFELSVFHEQKKQCKIFLFSFASYANGLYVLIQDKPPGLYNTNALWIPELDFRATKYNT